MNNVLIKKLEDIKNKNQRTIQEYLDDLAKYIFGNVQIVAGDDFYTFVEVEFYYHDDKDFDGYLYNCTYPRTRKTGRFFWHNSGVDICFDSNENEGYFGGMLIRTLLKNGNEIVAGPMRCANELKNSCNEKVPNLCLPEEKSEKQDLFSTYRYGVGDEKQTEKDPKLFCYYVIPETWIRTRTNIRVIDYEHRVYKKLDKKKDPYSAQPTKRGCNRRLSPL